jgi:Family of unknown function (DUF6165)
MRQSKTPAAPILAPISIGELSDKITILEIKAERMADRQRLRNVAAELALLRALTTKAGLDTREMTPYAQELKTVNGDLWDIEEAIRECEERGDFGVRFVELARSLYRTNDQHRTNDQRARVKQRINGAFGSSLIEEKSYKGKGA